MKDQILKIMEAEGLTPAKFADEIGVQRSSISHIISSRNKPSYDFILKILKRFTGVNTEWLLTGKGSMIKSNEFEQREDANENTLFEQKNDLIIQEEFGKENQISPSDTLKNFEKNTTKSQKGEEGKSIGIKEFTNVNNVDYILVFYQDGTFRQYNSRE